MDQNLVKGYKAAAQEAWKIAGEKTNGKDGFLSFSGMLGLLCLQRETGGHGIKLQESDVPAGGDMFYQCFSWTRDGQTRRFRFIGVSRDKLTKHPTLQTLGLSFPQPGV